MYRLLATTLAGQDFISSSGNHLIGVHVGLRSRASLPNDQRELAVEVASSNFRGSLLNHFGKLGIKAADTRVHACGCLLDETQCMDDLAGHLFGPPERKVLDRPLCLSSPISVGRNLDRPEAVGLGARSGGHQNPLEQSLRRASAMLKVQPCSTRSLHSRRR